MSNFDHKSVDIDFQIAPRSIEAPDRPLTQPQIFINVLAKANATPSVKNTLKHKLQNTGAQNITNFLHGQEGQEIQILGDGHSVIKNNSTIKTLSGSDISPAATSTVYKFTLFNVGTKISPNYIWIQH